jgi:prepilin-type N-terminal cleavage/methylation domain-containing protein
MTRSYSTAARPGFTLVEIMVCCLIIALLMGIIIAAGAPARERARETTCLSNLHQIGKAIEMYRQDYGGGEPPAALTLDQLGFPPEPSSLLPYLGGNRGVFLCADEVVPPELRNAPVDPLGLRISYMWPAGAHEGMPNDFPSFRRQVERRGNDSPVVIDTFHQGAGYGENSTRPWLHKYLILRLDGRVEDRIIDDEAVGASWKL